MHDSAEILASLPYRPASPQIPTPRIGLIGCGGVSGDHLRAYRNGGFDVVALCDIDRGRAEKRAAEYFPDASIFVDYRELLRHPRVEVVDIATHPAIRAPMIEEALEAGKHVLSQKPFVLDLDVGERLVELADRKGCYLAVNQNGRWAPHFSYARLAAQSGVLGDVFSAHLECHWDHTWVAGTEFERVRHLILYDYAIHWFDIVRCLLPGKSVRHVFASTTRIPGQTLMPNLLGQALIEFDEAQSTLSFDAGVPHGSLEETYVAGTLGSLHSTGSGNQQQAVRVTTERGTWSPRLQGTWFPDGFQGTMAELLCAIQEGRPSTIDARDNLESLALCFAAIASADTGKPVVPGRVRQVPA